MFVAGGVYYRTGIGSFDPVSDGRLSVGLAGLMSAGYFTFRAVDDPGLPKGCRQMGVILADHNDHMLFVGKRNFHSFPYVEKVVIPTLVSHEGYEHSKFAGVFATPETVAELVDKLALINELYFGVDPSESRPVQRSGNGCSWQGDDEKGIVDLVCPTGLSGNDLERVFYNIIVKLKPHNYHYNPLLPGAKIGVPG